MTALLWETALLLLAAYFLGAWIACMIRRTFFARVGNLSSDETQHQSVDEAPAVASGPVPLPAAPTAGHASGRLDRTRADEGPATGPGLPAGASVQRSTTTPARAPTSAAAVAPAPPLRAATPPA